MPPADDPFAAWLLSLVGAELPLSVEQQTLLVSLLGVFALFTMLLLLLLFFYGLGACCEGMVCLRSHTVASEGFLVLDEKTDVEVAAFQALAKAELVDGTPRIGAYPVGRPAYGYELPQSALGVVPASYRAYEHAPPAPHSPATHAGGSPYRGEPMPMGSLPPRLNVPTPPTTCCASPGSGAATVRGRPSSPFAARSGDSPGATSARSTSPGLAALSSRRGTPRQQDNGWRDKESPAWYGV